ncbi:MAG: DUF2760 domain-containing protein [Pirellulaceae bacterium]
MGRISLAFKLFFGILFNRELAEKVETALLEPPKPKPTAEPSTPPPVKKPQPEKGIPGLDALILLATLQREARFLDLFQEDLSGYEDAQIGAAVRDVHRDTKGVLERLFAIGAVRPEEEGSKIDLPPAIDSQEIRFVGNVQKEKPASGTLVHGGWKATRCELPKFSGSAEAAKILAPAEVELT